MTTSRRGVYVWVTWLTPLLSGDAQCEWAAWFKSHYQFTKLERGGFDLATWKVEHAAMVEARVEELRAEGWTVFVEGQNQFTLRGAAATVAGRPDIVATRGADARVIDCKSGKRRDSDVQQVLIYLLALPLYHPMLKGVDPPPRLVGELQYRDGGDPVVVEPEFFTPALRDRITALIKRIGNGLPLTRVPSASECRFCDIGPGDCPDRVETSQGDVAVPTLF